MLSTVSGSALLVLHGPGFLADLSVNLHVLNLYLISAVYSAPWERAGDVAPDAFPVLGNC